MTDNDKHALIPILTNLYQQIYAIEEEWGIRLHEGDQRPRIDYFHDAIRALTSGEADIYAKHSRLSIEHLAYDMSQLRQAQANPVSERSRTTQQSPHLEVTTTGEEQAKQARRAARPDRYTKSNLSQYYKDYSVLFAALFVEAADRNYFTRQEEIDNAVEDMALVEQVLTQLAEGQIDMTQAQLMLDHVQQDDLRDRIMEAINSRTIRHTEAEMIIQQLRSNEARLDAERVAINNAHTHYKMSQFALYEESKETIKRLAAQGMNLAGRFVDNALQQSAGRGQGLDR